MDECAQFGVHRLHEIRLGGPQLPEINALGSRPVHQGPVAIDPGSDDVGQFSPGPASLDRSEGLAGKPLIRDEDVEVAVGLFVGKPASGRTSHQHK